MASFTCAVYSGTPEIISDTVDGFLFEAGNQDDLQQKLTYVLTRYMDLTQVRAAALKKASTKFSLQGMAENYNSILKSFVSSKNEVQ